MDNNQDAPFNVLSDTYHVWVPIEDDDLVKSVEVDANGDYIVQGVMTSEDTDEEGDSITPDGMDCSYFLTKGWIKYEHGNNPQQFIGEPIDVRVGRFEHPVLKKPVNGILVKGRLFAHRELAKQAVQTIMDLQKSNTKRRMGWSIEGNVKERCRKTGKILKSVLRNVVLTMNPVNTMTWVELAKSFAKNHEVEVLTDEPMEKAMDTHSIAEITRQSVEGAPKEDPQSRFIKMFRKFVKDHMTKKFLRKSLVTSASSGEVGVNAYIYARQGGLDYEEAVEFASYIADRHDLLKSLIGKFGGETMSKEAQSKLAELLDTELEELQKSLELDEESDEEETPQNYVGEDGDDDTYEGDEDGDDEDSEDEDDDEVEKSVGSELRKSLSEEHGQAFEVSDFLSSLVDEIGFNLEGVQKSMSHMTKQQATLIKSMTSVISVVQEMTQQLEEVKAENAELKKSLSEVLERPVGRKSVVNQREVTTLSKSMGSEARRLTRGEVQDLLLKSFEAGEINGAEIARFEAGVPLERLNLPRSVKEQLGLV